MDYLHGSHITASKLTEEMRQALARCPNGPIPFEDEKTQSYHMLLTKEDYARLQNDYLRRELQVALDQVDGAEVSDLDMKELRAEAHRRHAARQRLS